MRTIAIDWSGKAKGAHKTIWIAEAAAGQLVRLECGRSRDEVAAWLIAEAARDRDLIAGLDFAFSMPQWYMRERGFQCAPALWSAMAGGEAERLLHACEPPLWGRPGVKRPPDIEHFRACDRIDPIAGVAPKSVFQIGGAGAVGTGSLRGMPVLHRLHEAGFSIWPFAGAGAPRAIEIYPRLLTGPVRKSRAGERARFLAARYPHVDPHFSAIAASTEDAFDAAISALVMSAHTDQLRALPRATDARQQIEGAIWAPSHASCACS
jgi:hypothetical protein